MSKAASLLESLSCRLDGVKRIVFGNQASAVGGGRFLELKAGGCEQVGILGLQISGGHAAVFGFNLDADAVAAGFEGRNHGRAGTAERIEDSVAGEGEHPHKAQSDFERERGGMVFG